MHRSTHHRAPDHPDDVLLHAWVNGIDDGVRDIRAIDAHLERCLVCSVRAARLEGFEVETPPPDVVDSLVAASPVLPDRFLRPPRDAPVRDVAPGAP